MLRIELAALSAQELKRLLDVARAREQTALAEQLLAELEARPVLAADWAPLPMSYAPAAEFAPAEADVRPRRSGVMAATAVLAAFVSAAVTWGISVPITPRAQPEERAQPAEAPRAAMVLASLAPVGPPAGYSEAATVADDVQAEPSSPPVQFARALPPRSTRTKGNPCYDLPTAAERLVCGYPTLAAHDRELRVAYDKALAAGVDRRELDRGQAQWRGESETVSDRKQLAERYQRRIRELESAAVKPPPEDPPF